MFAVLDLQVCGCCKRHCKLLSFLTLIMY